MALANGEGVDIKGGTNNTVGGTAAGAGNTISGNSGQGIRIYGSGTTGNVIEGNRIGTTPDGLSALPNASDGVDIVFGASSNIIGGTVAGSGNLISGNKQYGIDLSVSGTSGNLVEGNLIGTNPAGSAALANEYGVFIDSGASGNTIGGTVSAAGNLISGNAFDGVHLEGSGTSGNIIQGNKIGTNANGSAALANGGSGVEIDNGPNNNTVGGSATGAGNLISGNKIYGVGLNGTGVAGNVTGNLVQGNRIGTTADGKTALGNSNSGVYIQQGASSNTIGGAVTGAGNVISSNQQEGVVIVGTGTTQNLVEGNFIGTSADGTASLPNTNGGVLILGGASNQHGGRYGGCRPQRYLRKRRRWPCHQ
jgi:hypothetical protein